MEKGEGGEGKFGVIEEEEDFRDASAELPDPALEGGKAREYCQRAFVAEVFGAEHSLRGRVLILGQSDPTAAKQQPSEVRLELTSERDLFFLYTHTLEQQEYDGFASEQGLTVPFYEYPSILARMLSGASRERSSLSAQLKHAKGESAVSSSSPDSAVLEFVHDTGYKLVSLLRVQCETAGEHVLRRRAQHRYLSVLHEESELEERLADVYSLVKLRAPSVFLQLQRNHAHHHQQQQHQHQNEQSHSSNSYAAVSSVNASFASTAGSPSGKQRSNAAPFKTSSTPASAASHYSRMPSLA